MAVLQTLDRIQFVELQKATHCGTVYAMQWAPITLDPSARQYIAAEGAGVLMDSLHDLGIQIAYSATADSLPCPARASPHVRAHARQRHLDQPTISQTGQ